MDKDDFARGALAAERTLYAVAKTMLINESDCEDAVADALLAAWQRLGSLREEKYFKTWLVRILINECKKRLRRRGAEVGLDNAEGLPAPEREDYSDLYRAVAALPPKIRAAVLLFYIEGFSEAETAAILKIPRGTVKSRLAAGRKFLKERLE